VRSEEGGWCETGEPRKGQEGGTRGLKEGGPEGIKEHTPRGKRSRRERTIHHAKHPNQFSRRIKHCQGKAFGKTANPERAFFQTRPPSATGRSLPKKGVLQNFAGKENGKF